MQKNDQKWVTLTIAVRPRDKERIKRYARREGLNTSAFLRTLVKKYEKSK